MRCTLLILLIACSLGLGLGGQPARPLHLVYVEIPHAVWSTEERTEARRSIEAALDFWQQLAPAPVALEIASEQIISTTEVVTAQLEWSRPYFLGPPALTIFLIDTTDPLLGSSWAQSQTPLGLIWAIKGSGGHFAATMAHELGHVVYGLPHAFGETDIMGLDPHPAYDARTIGCESMARLGRPCARLWLPVVAGG